MELLHRELAEGKVLYGGRGNRYYTDPRSRVLAVSIWQHPNGTYANLQAGRTMNYADPATEVEFYAPTAYPAMYSPVLSLSPHSGPKPQTLLHWCDTMLRWAKDHYTGQLTAYTPRPAELEYGPAPTRCPKCDHLNVLHTTMQSYGNTVTCTRSECTFSDYYSIGD